MQVGKIETKNFMSKDATQFVIPVYQRNYDWGYSHCQRLLDDILKTGTNHNVVSHFLGSVVYIHDDVYTSSKLKELTIIDGQQRLTTLTLIFAALRQHALQNDRKTLADEFHNKFLITRIDSESQEESKLKPTENNREVLRAVLKNQPERIQFFSRIVENYNFFRKKINNENFDLIREGINKLTLVELSLERGKDDPQRIFESLNSTGLDLSQADLVRNYVLMDLTPKDQEKYFKNYWSIIENNAHIATSNESRVSDFLRDFLTFKNKKIPTKEKVYETFKSQFPTTVPGELKEILSDLTEYSDYYGKLLNPSTEKDRDISKHLAYIKLLEINVAYPFLLQVYADYIKQIINKETLVDVLELLQSYTWRRFVVGLPSNALNKVFMGLYERVDTHNYLYSIQRSLLERSGAARFPTDKEVNEKLMEKDFYHVTSKSVHYLFDRLENHDNNEPVSFLETPSVTIEHIFPQKPDPKWKEQLPPGEYKILSEKFLHTIGNLTVSGNNGALGNKTFLEKRDMNVHGGEQGYQFSRLWLNRDLKEKSEWNQKEIELRTQRLTERFFTIWKFPQITLDEPSSNNEINIFEADDPTNRKLEYAIFFEQKLDIENITELFTLVIQRLFELQPQMFFNTPLQSSLGITQNPQKKGKIQFAKLNDTYFFKTTFSSLDKFRLLKEALTSFDYDDELYIKYT